MKFQYLMQLSSGIWELRIGEIGEPGADVFHIPRKFAEPLLEEMASLRSSLAEVTEKMRAMERGNASHWYVCYSEMKKATIFLWGLLDDIDTADDIAKSDDKAYRKIVQRIQSKRWETGITTDGQMLDFGSITPTLPSESRDGGG